MDFEESHIERLKRALYSRNESVVPKDKRTPVQGLGSTVPENWGDDPSFAYSPEVMKQKNNSFFNKFLLFSVLFFVVAAGIAAFIFFGGMNLISSNNIDVKITGPSSISSGEELDLGISVINQNRTDLENVTLFIEYPDSAKSVDEGQAVLTRGKIPLATIAKGQSKEYPLRALLFGEKDAIKTITFRVEYTIKGSNSVFSKEKTYEVTINSSPILLNVSYPKEINSGQLVTLTIDITSNSPVVVSGALVKVEYPYGFTYKDSSMTSIRDSLWSVGDLKNGDKKTLKVTGQLVGQNMEERSFRVSIGTPSGDNSKDFDTTLSASQVTIGIRKSFFNLAVQSDTSVDVGQSASISVTYQNTLPEKIVNSRIVTKISGNIFDRNRVSANNNGYYRSSDTSVTWDKNTTPALGEMLPGVDGQVSLAVGSFTNPAQIRSIKNPYIDVSTVMTGNRSGTDQSEVSSSQDITIKFSTNLGIYAKSYRTTGPITNTGPVPPRVDRESTYTVVWGLTNTTNEVKDAVVTAVLPAYVTWKGETFPTNEGITYNPDTRTVTWNAGSIATNIGYGYAPRTVTFKIGATPSTIHVGNSLDIVVNTIARATDTFTSKKLSVGGGVVTTHFSDPGFKSGDDIVVK